MGRQGFYPMNDQCSFWWNFDGHRDPILVHFEVGELYPSVGSDLFGRIQGCIPCMGSFVGRNRGICHNLSKIRCLPIGHGNGAKIVDDDYGDEEDKPNFDKGAKDISHLSFDFFLKFNEPSQQG